ncbi:hypothetical protein SPRG_00331 [Saprolegnia parasitica CBS 223.65]|uniref:Uncharacterized protein n=1 Tax=Saprolegnia parasitica (strain CBS 223.65) TaxID=695850 RepID=A0A067CXP6_SAPPC|nr:hypothetical protein SPRG_00331 [Saprolegnia parasitica CBS 223.65]KDO35484.1 hypothetical protein SPRG_00331 [Saprolegnia parasitica CBS 223.65]|eukprot:XP_012193821.1 hypothetical protein SPRG_00331 [Saprolegnia parasitica CBS 223.65]
MGVCASELKYLARPAKVDQNLTLLVRHAVEGRVDDVRAMVQRTPKLIRTVDRFGMSALHWACYAGKLPCVTALLEAGANVQQADTNKRNALHHACRKGHLGTIQLLVTTHRMDVNRQSGNGDTPLHKAVLAGSPGATLLLLYYGADPTLPNLNCDNAIQEVQAKIAQTIARSRRNPGAVVVAPMASMAAVVQASTTLEPHTEGDFHDLSETNAGGETEATTVEPFHEKPHTTPPVSLQIAKRSTKRLLRASTTKVILSIRQKQALGQYEVIAHIFSVYNEKATRADEWRRLLEEYTPIRVVV